MLALLFAVMAILSQPVRPPSTFIEGLRAATPAIDPYFIGLQWPCLPDYQEVCYAGLEYGFDDAAGFVTGP